MVLPASGSITLSLPFGSFGASMSTYLYPSIFTRLNQSTADTIACLIRSEGFLTRIRNRTTPTDSFPLMDTSSNFLAISGCKVRLLYCAHQAVNLPFTTICVASIHSIPLRTASFALGIKAASTTSKPFFASTISCNTFITLIIASSLYVIWLR